MLRTLLGYAILAVLAVFALKLLLGLFGLVFGLLWTVLWLALLGFGLYVILRLVAPGTAARVREMIRGY
jgi:hypothetical protein